MLIHSKNRNSKYIEIAGGGHFIHLTHHAIVSKAILEFLKNNEELGLVVYCFITYGVLNSFESFKELEHN